MKGFIRMVSKFSLFIVPQVRKSVPSIPLSQSVAFLRRILKGIHHACREFAKKNFPITGQIGGIPLIKATTSFSEIYPGCLRGQSVLCVGGQIQLYPAYKQIVEDAGGKFLSFHGVGDAALTDLDSLLRVTDLVICPIDCIRHDAFFRTKYYCKYTNKPCVILDKARVTTFYNGIQMLKQFATT